MQNRIFAAVLAGVVLVSPTVSHACEGTECVLASRGEIDVYPIDLEASLGDLDAGVRAGVLQKPERIDRLIDNVLINRQLAEMAKTSGYDKDPIVQRQMLLAAERVLAEHARLDELKRRAEATDFETYAREQYAIRIDQFQVPDTTVVAHILVATENLCQEDALARAKEIHAKALSGEDYEDLVQTYSDDDSKIHNQGRIEVNSKTLLDPAFKEAALSLQTPGDISSPVRSVFGYHIIKLIEKRPGLTRSFEDVKPSLMQTLEANYQRRVKDTLLSDLRADDPLINAEAMQSFRARFTEME